MKKTHSSLRSLLLLCGAVFAAVWLLYVGDLSNGFAFDDKSLIVDNTFLSHRTSLSTIFSTNYRAGSGFTGDGLYRPVVMLSYLLNSGPSRSPLPFHLFNNTLHALNAALLVLLAAKLFGSLPLAVLAGLIFGFHPVHTEAVANITGRPEIMWVMFLLAGWLVYLYRPRRIWAIGAASVLFFGALLSKETAVLFPILLFAIDHGVRGIRIDRRTVFAYTVFAGIVGIYLVLRWHVLGSTAAGLDPKFVDNPIAHAPLISRESTALVVFLKYILLLVIPYRLTADYSYNQIPILSSLLHPLPLLGIALLAGMIAYVWIARRRSPILLCSLVLFLIPYLFVSNLIFPIGTIMGERLLYFPVAGFALAISLLFQFTVKRWKTVSVVSAAFLLGAYGVKSYSRSLEWRSDTTLFTADARTSPRSVKVLCNLGYLAGARGSFDESLVYYRRALEIFPDFDEALRGYGKKLYDLKRYDESVQYYARAVSVSPDNTEIRNDYGIVLEKIQRYGEAEEQFAASIRMNPSNPIPYQEMGGIMLIKGEYGHALEYLRRAETLGGDSRLIMNNSAAAEFLSGNISGAYILLQKAESMGIPINDDLAANIRARAVQR
jgi:protein O-mannosyl-transferase